MLIVDEVAGAYIAWGARACLQITKSNAAMLKLMNVKQVPTKAGWEGSSPKDTAPNAAPDLK